MDKDMQLYYDYTVSALGTVFYQTVWKQLEVIRGKKVLDFGSGFGFTSQFLARHNTVIAVEMDQSMIDAAEKSDTYEQVHGDLSALTAYSDKSFDVIVCHMVFEFVDNAQEILTELMRVLKDDGVLSIVRHNKAGRIIQAMVQEKDFEETEKLLQGGFSYSSAFGDIKYYDNTTLLQWAEYKLAIESVHGVRALASLHDAQTQEEPNWLEAILRIEDALLQDPSFISIAYFNHLFLKKV